MKTTSQFAFIAIAGVLLAACGKTADPNIQSHKPTAGHCQINLVSG